MANVSSGSEGFRKYAVDSGVVMQTAHEQSRFEVAAWTGGPQQLAADATHFGYVQEGTCDLEGNAGRFPLRQGMYFSLPGSGTLGGAGSGVVISEHGGRGLFQLGGPVEKQGRLHYIDGCSDTLLLSPVVRGDACLNLLVIPPHTHQTAHTHPSFRAGIIATGTGLCRLSSQDVPLEAGDLFVIEPDTLHSFHTEASSLTVIAFHPDSDFGPHRDDHPMVNRTIVDGVAASRLSLAQRRIGGHAS
jgi:quercetin dioxygenase-like cupin family protein